MPAGAESGLSAPGQRAEQSPHLQVRKGPALDSHRDG